MACKGICKRYPPHPPNNKIGKGMYSNPENCRCRICDRFMAWEGNYCPCCGYRVSRIPKSTSARIKKHERNNVKRIE